MARVLSTTTGFKRTFLGGKLFDSSEPHLPRLQNGIHISTPASTHVPTQGDSARKSRWYRLSASPFSFLFQSSVIQDDRSHSVFRQRKCNGGRDDPGDARAEKRRGHRGAPGRESLQSALPARQWRDGRRRCLRQRPGHSASVWVLGSRAQGGRDFPGGAGSPEVVQRLPQTLSEAAGRGAPTPHLLPSRPRPPPAPHPGQSCRVRGLGARFPEARACCG